jgi:hypothetical protein
MKQKNISADNQIKQLQQDIQRLTDELAASERLTDYYANCYESAEKQRIACRRLLKYHTMVMILLNLVSRYTSCNDMGMAIQTNINKYYKGLTESIMSIPGDDSIDNEFEDDDEEDKDGEEEC